MYSIHFTNQMHIMSVKDVAPTFRYKRIIFREHNMPGLKPIASDKPLFTLFHSLH
jgi:hypothetical protein